MGLEIESVVDGGMAGKESLGRALRLELLLLPLPSPDHQVRVFSPVVLAQSTWPMVAFYPEILVRGPIRRQLVCGDRHRATS